VQDFLCLFFRLFALVLYETKQLILFLVCHYLHGHIRGMGRIKGMRNSGIRPPSAFRSSHNRDNYKHTWDPSQHELMQIKEELREMEQRLEQIEGRQRETEERQRKTEERQRKTEERQQKIEERLRVTEEKQKEMDRKLAFLMEHFKSC
jgi:vacuolar-type H+-ATPase subunit I/STV1